MEARDEASRLTEIQLASARDAHARLADALDVAEGYRVGPVSYTHLTLPTICSV